MTILYVCPDCSGDGKETCHNPDHGLISAMSFHDIGRLGCPVCGVDAKHKVRRGGDCETCDGTGEVGLDAARFFCDGQYDFEEIMEICDPDFRIKFEMEQLA